MRRIPRARIHNLCCVARIGIVANAEQALHVGVVCRIARKVAAVVVEALAALSVGDARHSPVGVGRTKVVAVVQRSGCSL